MEPNERLTQALGEAKKRRQTLHDAIVQLEMAISSPAAGRVEEWSSQVTKDMVGVRDAFDQHVIVTEKPGGLYEEIMERAPRLVGTVGRLREEHPTIDRRSERSWPSWSWERWGPTCGRSTRRATTSNASSARWCAIARRAPTSSGRRTTSTSAGPSSGR